MGTTNNKGNAKEGNELYLSKSSVGMYNECAYRYKLAYIDGVRVPPNKYFVRGIAVHEYLDRFYRELSVNNGELVIPQIPTQKAYASYFDNVIIFTSNRFKNIKEKKPQSVLRYLKPVLAEKKIVSTALKLKGVVDAVFYNFQDEPVIVEYKTGYPTPAKIAAYANDLYWYKMLLEEEKHFNNIRLGSIYFPSTNDSPIVRLDSLSITVLKKMIENTRARILAGLFEPNWSLCATCDYAHVCDKRQV